MKYALWYCFILLLLLTACLPYEEPIPTEVVVDLNDPIVQKIFTFQDRQQADSLYRYFRHPNPDFRYLSARAFGSFGSEDHVDSLVTLLKDLAPPVRAAAAYALGQTGTSMAEGPLIKHFESQDTAGVYAVSNAAILEAVGKCGTEETLDFLSTIETYQIRDTHLITSQVKGLYRFGLKSKYTEAAVNRMVELLQEPELFPEARLYAAEYLGRFPVDLDGFEDELRTVFENETDPTIKMELISALGRSGKAEQIPFFEKILQSETDYRIQVNAIRALSQFEYDSVAMIAEPLLKATNQQLALTAANFFYESGLSKNATDYWRLAKDSVHWRVSAVLYQATQKHLPLYYTDYREFINREIRRKYQTASNPYSQAAWLTALGEYPWNYRLVRRLGFEHEAPVVRTTAASTLRRIAQREDFQSFFRSSANRVAREIAFFLEEGLQSGDSGMIAELAPLLQHESPNYARYLSNTNFLDTLLQQLELPREVETFNVLQSAISSLRGEKAPEPQRPAFNHPIPWDLLTSINKEFEAEIRTEKGTIRMDFLPSSAPATVLNFVELARSGYFNNKTFHRVVPNFVAQGGCPRGDGYGSLDYSIRSELPPLYYNQTGLVGMASAGRHTEGVQFFITHSPTPHLDGNYTIFARIKEGMEVVHELSIGDRILEVHVAR